MPGYTAGRQPDAWLYCRQAALCLVILQAGSLMPGSPVCLAVSGSEGRDQQEHNYSSDQGIQVGEIDL
jgi:hypothetical protein